MNNQYIIIQGPTKYYQEIITCYRGYPNIIFSTFDTEDPKILTELSNHFITNATTFNFQPGFGNLNCQTKTSFVGLTFAKLRGATHALKIRSDMIVSNLPAFMQLLEKHDRLSFLVWHDGGYLIDYLNYGPIDDMLDFWNVFRVNNIFAEKNLMNNFSNIKKEPLNTFDDIKRHVDFFMKDLMDMDIRIYWLKYNIYVTDYYKYECYKYK